MTTTHNVGCRTMRIVSLKQIGVTAGNSKMLAIELGDREPNPTKPEGMANDRIALIVLNYGGREDTATCLRSLRSQTYKHIDTIVIDNGSEDDEVSPLRAEFPAAHVVGLTTNLGFARAVNIGLEIANDLQSRYVLLLNNDAWLDEWPSMLAEMVKTLESDPSAGAVGPVILDALPPYRIQSAGHMYNPWTSFPKRLLSFQDRTTPIAVIYPDLLVANCLLMQRETLNRIGAMDPDFFFYSEDFDLGLRMKEHGLRQRIVPSAFLYHYKAAKTTQFSERHIYAMLRGHLVLVSKHARWYHWPTLAPSLAAITAGFIVYGLRRGNLSAFRGAFRAWRDFLAKRWWGFFGEPLPPVAPLAELQRHT